MKINYFRHLIFTVFFLFVIILAPLARADVSIPTIFSDHMVLQADTAVPVWGWAAPGEEITVEFAGQKKTVVAGNDGNQSSSKNSAVVGWMIKLDPLKASPTPQSMTVSSVKNSKSKNLQIADILVGEVWLCSGQSNMAWTVDKALDYEKEKAAADFPKIRMFIQQTGPMVEPFAKGNGIWKVCSPETVAGFSATAYFFGRNLHQKLKQPVGLINSSVGGTPIEAWTSLEIQKTLPELKPLLEDWEKRQAVYNPETAKSEYEKQLEVHKEAVAKAKAEGKAEPRPPYLVRAPRTETRYPGNLFNGKIFPLIPFAIRGAVWYQGESNAFTVEGGRLYEKQLPLLIKDWRTCWGQGDFPFAWVQLPNLRAVKQFPGWCEVRESMLKTLSVPNTGMVVAIDLGESNHLHPLNKQEVGRRLALWALAKVYGDNIAFSGPLPAGNEIKGAEITCSFKYADGGLKARDGELKGFTISGADRKWIKAVARINGDKVIVSSPEIKEPVAVRYAWEDDPDCNLINGAGLPASPFRTDNWQ